MATKDMNVFWVDDDGEQATQRVHVLSTELITGTEADDFIDAIDAASAAAVQRAAETAWLTGEAAAVDEDAPYDIRDKLILEFLTVSGGRRQVAIPAPLLDNFSDSDTALLPADTGDSVTFDALIDAFIAVGSVPNGTTNGDLFEEYLGGWREMYNRKH